MKLELTAAARRWRLPSYLLQNVIEMDSSAIKLFQRVTECVEMNYFRGCGSISGEDTILSINNYRL